MGPMMSLDPNIYAVGEPELLRTWPSFRRTAGLSRGRLNWVGECFVPGEGDSGRWSRRTSTLASRVEGLGGFKRGAVARFEVALC